MNWIDLLLIFLIAVALYAGWCLRGLMLIAAGLALILGPLAGSLFAPLLGPKLAPFVQDIFPGEATAFWLIVLVVATLFFLSFRLLSGLFEKLKLGWLDQMLGALFLGGLIFYASSLFFLQVVAKNPAAKTGPAMKSSWFCSKAFPRVRDKFPVAEALVAKMFPAAPSPAPVPAPLHPKHKHRKKPSYPLDT